MSHPLQRTIGSLRRRARAATALSGVCRTTTAVVGVAFLMGLTDYVVRFEDPGIRVLASLAVVAALVYHLYYRLIVPLARRLRDIDLAALVERRFPQFGDALCSAVEFVKQPAADPQAGSAALRRAVISQANAEVERLDLAKVFNFRPVVRAAGAAAVALALVGVLALVAPASVGVGASRLVNPLGSVTWPKRNDLAFRNVPSRLASGQTFEVELVDRNGNLPDEVRIHYRHEVDGVWTEAETKPMQFIDGVMVARREHVVQPFEYRAEGGDDNAMPWTRLEVVEPPRVDQFQVTLYPPPYTGRPPQESDKRIRAIKGTRVEVAGTATKVLATAQVKLEEGRAIDARLAADGLAFHIAADDFIVEKSGTYWFQLTDKEGLSGGTESRWELRALVDAAPSVSIEQPATNTFVTPDAVVPLQILVKDDLAIHKIWLRYIRSDKSDQGDIAYDLYVGPQKAAPPAEGAIPADEEGETRVVEQGFSLRELGVAPGVQIALTALASDYLPQTGESGAARRITVISKPELEDRLAQRQSLVLGELARVLKMQREARGQTTSLEVQLDTVGALAKADLDDLQAAELNQRQVERTLIDKQDGIPPQIHSLLNDLKSNNIDAPGMERQLLGLLAEIERLGKDHLPAIRNELVAALKSAQLSLDAQGRSSDGRTHDFVSSSTLLKNE